MCFKLLLSSFHICFWECAWNGIPNTQNHKDGECATPIWRVNTALAKDDVRSRLVVNIIKWSRWTHHNFPSTSLIWILCTLLWWVWASVLTIGWPLWSLHPYYAYFTQWYSPLANSYSWCHLLPMLYWPPIWKLHTLMWYSLDAGGGNHFKWPKAIKKVDKQAY